MENLVGQEIRCRIIKLDATEEDVVVDRRAPAEEEERGTKERRYSEIREGETVRGTVRSLTDYGAFIDLGGVDGLLHVGEIAWSRISKPADLLSSASRSKPVLKVDSKAPHFSGHETTNGPGYRKNTTGRARAGRTCVLEFGASWNSNQALKA
jgi:small subunit ribosomal protein S1